jgi:hypothetical protein
MQATFKIVQMVAGQMVVSTPTDIVAWAQANGRSISPTRSPHLRPELQLAPRIQGLCGPMWDGLANGVPVIRYEDGASNDVLSR